MSQTTLPPVSNRAGWTLTRELVDEDTGDAIDISTASIVVEIRDPFCDTSKLSATTSNGKVTITGTGTFDAVFTVDDMGTLDAYTYKVGGTLTMSGETQQLFIYDLPVLDGVVTR